MEESEIFEGCKRIARNFIFAKNKRKQLADIEKSRREILLGKIQENLLNQCNTREKEFLNLKTTDGEKVLDSVMGQFDASKSTVPGLYEFQINPLKIEITPTELNNNRFYYDSKRAEIREILYSIFSDKLGMCINVTFDNNEKYVLAFYSNAKYYSVD
jgi:hypothetical protein